jgi:hypothetical protein
MLSAAIARDDSRLLSLLLSAQCRLSVPLDKHVMGLLAHTSKCDAPACALLLCNRMLIPGARLRPATEDAPAQTVPFMSVAAGLDVRGLRQLASEALRQPQRRRVAFALVLGWRRAVAASADSRASQEGGNHDAEEEEDGEEEEGGNPALPGWPEHLVRTRRLGDGTLETYGDDVSDGVEARPVPWRNSLGDGALPPPVVYIKHCLAGDSEAVVSWVGKAPKPCRGDGLHFTAPQGATIRCSAWCPQPSPSPGPQQHERGERRLSDGLPWRLEVFRKSTEVGWALRTLDFIPKGALVMEYCGEHCSRATAERRVAAWRETDIFLMEIGIRGGPRGGLSIDALHARNVSAFANFSCSPNMRKSPLYAEHWDRRLPHAAFFATRPIQAGEELTYRRDEAATTSQKRRGAWEIACRCGSKDCRKWV